jgi:hypothetical protein
MANSYKTRAIVTSALREIGVLSAGETPTAEDWQWGLEKLQRRVDQFNARRDVAFSVSLQNFTLQANHAPHTIGPSGDFNIPLRPVLIKSAIFILNGASANPVDTPIHIRDSKWWVDNPLKSLTSEIVTDLYYDPNIPLGALNFFPICNRDNPIRLEFWNSLTQPLTLDTILAFAPGYWEATIVDLAVSLCPSYDKAISQDLREQWNRAMRIIEANNEHAPRIDTNTGGMPDANRQNDCRPDFNFLTGLRE